MWISKGPIEVEVTRVEHEPRRSAALIDQALEGERERLLRVIQVLRLDCSIHVPKVDAQGITSACRQLSEEQHRAHHDSRRLTFFAVSLRNSRHLC